jgi:hypothetical protein
MLKRIVISEEERKDIQSLYEEFDAKDGYVIHQNTKFSVEHPKLGELCINNYDGTNIGIGKRTFVGCSPTIKTVSISPDKKSMLDNGLTASINNNRPFNFETEEGSLTFKKV